MRKVSTAAASQIKNFSFLKKFIPFSTAALIVLSSVPSNRKSAYSRQCILLTNLP
jgi:hypothetical protein